MRCLLHVDDDVRGGRVEWKMRLRKKKKKRERKTGWGVVNISKPSGNAGILSNISFLSSSNSSFIKFLPLSNLFLDQSLSSTSNLSSFTTLDTQLPNKHAIAHHINIVIFQYFPPFFFLYPSSSSINLYYPHQAYLPSPLLILSITNNRQRLNHF